MTQSIDRRHIDFERSRTPLHLPPNQTLQAIHHDLTHERHERKASQETLALEQLQISFRIANCGNHARREKKIRTRSDGDHREGEARNRTEMRSVWRSRRELAKLWSEKLHILQKPSHFLFSQPSTLNLYHNIPSQDQAYNNRLIFNLLAMSEAKLVEPRLTLLMSYDPRNEAYREAILRPDQSQEDKVWNGENMSEGKLREATGVREIHTFSGFQRLGRWWGGEGRRDDDATTLFTDSDSLKFVRGMFGESSEIREVDSVLNEQEVRKSPGEIKRFRKSVEITCEAMRLCNSQCAAQFTSESDFSAFFAYQCHRLGASSLAFPPVVASNANSTAIHYLKKTCKLKMHDTNLLLMDAGCRFEGFCSDISRTWSLNGPFKARERFIYNIVSECRRKCFEQIRESLEGGEVCTFGNLLKKSLEFIGSEIRREVLKENLDMARILTDCEIGSTFCPHHIGHHIGLYLHDCPNLENSNSRQFENGMCFTIEPGIYINRNCQLVKEEFRGIGVRLED